MKLNEFEKSKYISGDDYDKLTGFGLAQKIENIARNGESGVLLLIKEFLILKQEILLLKDEVDRLKNKLGE